MTCRRLAQAALPGASRTTDFFHTPLGGGRTRDLLHTLRKDGTCGTTFRSRSTKHAAVAISRRVRWRMTRRHSSRPFRASPTWSEIPGVSRWGVTMALTHLPYGPSFEASVRKRKVTPGFDAQRAAMPVAVRTALPKTMLTMAPDFFFNNCWTALREHTNTPSRLTRRQAFQASIESPITCATRCIPAAHASTLMPPSREQTSSPGKEPKPPRYETIPPAC